MASYVALRQEIYVTNLRIKTDGRARHVERDRPGAHMEVIRASMEKKIGNCWGWRVEERTSIRISFKGDLEGLLSSLG